MLSALALGSCKKYVEVKDLDKEIQVDFPLKYSFAYLGPNYNTLPDHTYLIDFNKRDYAKVDSICFYALVSSNSLTDSVYVRLFNVTDNVEIANSSLVAATGMTMKMLHTNNLTNSLPAADHAGYSGKRYTKLSS